MGAGANPLSQARRSIELQEKLISKLKLKCPTIDLEEVLSKMYISFGYYDFYRHREDKNNCDVLEIYAGWSGCNIKISTEILVRSSGSLDCQ